MGEVKEEFVVSYEAAERGSLVQGELKSEQAIFPSMLVQFSKIVPSSRKAKIFFYPTLEQVKSLFAMRPIAEVAHRLGLHSQRRNLELAELGDSFREDSMRLVLRCGVSLKQGSPGAPEILLESSEHSNHHGPCAQS